MKQFSTHEQLIRFLYKETNAQESLELLEAMGSDEDLLQEYSRLASTYRQLGKVNLCAGKQSIQRILEYSR
jgi:hypothetical protein